MSYDHERESAAERREQERHAKPYIEEISRLRSELSRTRKTLERCVRERDALRLRLDDARDRNEGL